MKQYGGRGAFPTVQCVMIDEIFYVLYFHLFHCILSKHYSYCIFTMLTKKVSFSGGIRTGSYGLPWKLFCRFLSNLHKCVQVRRGCSYVPTGNLCTMRNLVISDVAWCGKNSSFFEGSMAHAISMNLIVSTSENWVNQTDYFPHFKHMSIYDDTPPKPNAPPHQMAKCRPCTASACPNPEWPLGL